MCFSVTTSKDNSLHMEILIRGLLLNGFHFLVLTKRINMTKEKTWRLSGLKSSYLWIVIIAVFKFCEPFLFSLFFCVHGCFACVFIYAPFVCLVPKEARQHQIWNWNEGQWATMTVLGTKSGSSATAASVLSCCTISPARLHDFSLTGILTVPLSVLRAFPSCHWICLISIGLNCHLNCHSFRCEPLMVSPPTSISVFEQILS